MPALAAQVLYTSNGTSWNPPTTLTACPPADQQTPNSQVMVSIDLQDPNLSPALKDIFEVNIPLLPPIPMKGTVSGVFRCEGT